MRKLLTLVVMAAAAAAGCGDDDDGPGGNSDGGGPGTIDAGPQTDAIVPDDPGPADVRFEVDTTTGVHAISPFIYGWNGADFAGHPYLTMTRSGGNRMTAYNWENNASNAGSDYLFQNDAFLGGGDTPGEAVRPGAADAIAHGAGIVVTIPIQGYVAADKNGGGDVNQTPNYLDVRFKHNLPTHNFIDPTPDLNDANVYQDEFVSLMENAITSARGGDGTGAQIFYCLDNEPDLWSSTHARIHPDPATYEELVNGAIQYGSAIKGVAPDALVFGPVSYGWAGYVNLQDAPDANNRDFLEYYLDRMLLAENALGHPVVDVLDLHWYPEAQGGGQRIVVDDAGDAVAAARVQAPRSLWDDAYTEDSWITQFSTNGPIRLIPRLREKIAAHDAGTKIAFTEYYYGGGADISGALAEADVLGIFGREGVFAAALWHIGNTDDSFIYAAFESFRDYDGAGHAFGATGVSATSDDIEGTSVYASVDAAGHVVIVAINKTNSSKSAGVRVAATTRFTTATPYVVTAAQAHPVAGAALPITLVNAFVYDMPAESVTTLVLE